MGEFSHFNSPLSQWQVLPSFVLGEWLFIVCAILALVHAKREGRDHVLIWIAALVAGTANDAIFMALPIVNNFWQAQGQIMLNVRMPLYIPCVYVCFMYYPTVAVRRLGLPPLAQAAATGMVACLFYAPYDIIGAKFLWWTWHDTDMPIAVRILGAPVGSSLWTLTFVSAFGWLVDRALAKVEGGGSEPAKSRGEVDPSRVSAKQFGLGLGLVAGCTTLMMMVQITALQQLDGGTPGYVALAGGWLIYAALVVVTTRKHGARPWAARAGDRLLLGAAIAYFVTLIGIMAAFDPQTHVSAGVHQTVGECYVEQTDITQLTRYEFLCVTDFDEDYTFACVDAPPEGEVRWYTVCGKAHTDFAAWMTGVGALGLVGIGLFQFMLGSGRERLRG